MMLKENDIERMVISTEEQRRPIVTNNSLSSELIEELSSDISDDGIVIFINIFLTDKWYKFSSNPTEIVGTVDGKPVYKTVWNNEDWLYLPFEFIMSSLKASGEIVGGGLAIANYHKELTLALENPTSAPPVKIYLVSKKTNELIYSQEKMYLTSIINNGIQIQGDLSPANVLEEQLPSLRNYPHTFRS